MVSSKLFSNISNISVVGACQRTSEFSVNFQGYQFSLINIPAFVYQCQIIIFFLNFIIKD